MLGVLLNLLMSALVYIRHAQCGKSHKTLLQLGVSFHQCDAGSRLCTALRHQGTQHYVALQLHQAYLYAYQGQ